MGFREREGSSILGGHGREDALSPRDIAEVFGQELPCAPVRVESSEPEIDDWDAADYEDFMSGPDDRDIERFEACFAAPLDLELD